MDNIDLVISFSVLTAGIWMISISFITYTKNFLSACIFKLIPFFLGCLCLFSAGKLFGMY